MTLTLAVVALLFGMAAIAGGTSSAESLAETACAPGYTPCLPVRADLDCDEIDDALKPIRRTGADQYGLDRDGDGLGCEVSGEGGGARSPWGLILRKPPRKEALVAKVGDTLTLAGWSPSVMKGETFEVCVKKARGRCVEGKRRLNGTVQVFGTWKVARADTAGGFLRLGLRVKDRNRADDGVRIG